ncbi:MAG: glycoside hydrolase family 3 N-terminal domain-containing protein [Pseudoxanthomonas sp.]
MAFSRRNSSSRLIPRGLVRGLLPAAMALALVATPISFAAAANGGTGNIDPAQWPQVAWPLAQDPALEKRIDELLATLTVEEKVGQIVQGDIASITPEDVRKYRLGSILAGGSSDPGGKYNAPAADWLALADEFWEASMDTSQGGKAIPVIWGIDAVHGQSNIVGATLFPHNIGLGATRNAELIRQIGRITAIETRVTGMEWTFAPTVAVPRDDRWGRSYEGYSESPDVVASFAPAMAEGLQGKPGTPEYLGDERVMTTIKHFLGDGGTTGGKDQGDTEISEAELRDIHAAGYTTGVAVGAQSVMASFNSFHGVRMHGHRPLLTDVLKGRMNFGGFIVGDWNGHALIDGCTATDCAATFNAGLDLAMAPDSWKGLYETTVKHVKDGTLPMARLDDAVRRILRVKFLMGLFEKPKPSQRALGGKYELLGSPEHRAVARQAVRESLVLLKNQGGVLPLNPKKKLLVAGDGADNIGKQAGGWTLSWQGTGTTRADFPNADTIWEGLKAQVEAAGGKAELAVDGKYKSRPDAAIVVFGEEPYAEFQGDLPNLLYKSGRSDDLDLLKRLKAEGIPVVAVFLSGRPLWMNREINASDAFVAAWLPGSEGAGVADVLLRGADGKPQHDFRGKLSFSWPKRADQYANNIGQAGYDPLFAFGYGLRYADSGKLAKLSEDSGLGDLTSAPGVYLARGVAAAGLRLSLTSDVGAPITVDGPQAQTRDGNLTLEAINYQVQEGARRLHWTGPARAVLQSTAPIDLSRETNGDVLLVTTLRVDALPADGKVELSARSGETQPAVLQIGDALAALPRGEWLRFGVPLKCLRSAGADTGKLDIPFEIKSSAGFDLSLAEVAAATDFQHKLECAQ